MQMNAYAMPTNFDKDTIEKFVSDCINQFVLFV